MTQTEFNRLRLYYFLFLVSYLLMLVPLTPAIILALVLVTGTLVASYMLRSKTDREGIAGQHATHLIRTFWISSFFLTIGIFLATSIIWANGDMSALSNMAMRVGEGQVLSEGEIRAGYSEYYETNKTVIWTASAVSIGPFFAYVVWRMGRGYQLLGKGIGFANAKSWF